MEDQRKIIFRNTEIDGDGKVHLNSARSGTNTPYISFASHLNTSDDEKSEACNQRHTIRNGYSKHKGERH